MTTYEIESVAFGGEGVARDSGLVVFIPFTLPGELVEASLEQKKKRFARASLLHIVKTSKERIDPLCPYFSVCGGCQLQHASYSEQLNIKRQFVEDSLCRIGKIETTVPPLIPSSSSFAYRRHISLQIRLVNAKWSLCFTKEDGSPLPIETCHLLHDEKDPILALLQDKLALFEESFPLEGRFKLLKVKEGYAAAFMLQKNLSSQDEKLLASSFTPFLQGLWIKTPQKMHETKALPLLFSCLNLEFFYSPFGFVQNHAEQSEKIYALAAALLKPRQKVLDLYCGLGISSLLLAKEGKKVIGIELSKESIALAKKNAKHNKIFPEEFVCSSAEDVVDKYIKSFSPDAILVNPPKTGLDGSIKDAFKDSCIKQIVYISCHPPTLARDLALLKTLGFSIEMVQSFDCFPQTTHVETVVNLIR